MRTHTPDGARWSGWAPRAHSSGREAYQTGEGAPIARPEAFGAWRSCAVARRWILWRSALVAVAAVDA